MSGVLMFLLSAGRGMLRADDDKVWEAGGPGGSADAVGKPKAGGAQAAQAPQRDGSGQRDQRAGGTLRAPSPSCTINKRVPSVCGAQARLREEHQALMEVIKQNTELLRTSSRLVEEKREIIRNQRKLKERVTPAAPFRREPPRDVNVH